MKLLCYFWSIVVYPAKWEWWFLWKLTGLQWPKAMQVQKGRRHGPWLRVLNCGYWRCLRDFGNAKSVRSPTRMRHRTQELRTRTRDDSNIERNWNRENDTVKTGLWFEMQSRFGVCRSDSERKRGRSKFAEDCLTH